MSGHLDNAPVDSYTGPRALPAYVAVSLTDARDVWGDDVIVTDGAHAWHLAPDGHAWVLLNPRDELRAAVRDYAADTSSRLVALVARLAPGTTTPERMPEPTTPGAVVDCTLDGQPARAMRAHNDTIPWIVTNTHAPRGPVWRAWDDLDDPTPHREDGLS